MSLSEKSSTTTEVTLLELTDQSAYNNRLVVKHFGDLTMLKALESRGKSIGLIAKDDEDTAIRCIRNLFQSVALYFDTNFTASKAETIATEILYKYEYRNLKLEDLVVICIRLKESEIYKLSPARILREIKSYSQEREKLAIKKSLSKEINMNEDLEKRLQKNYYLTPDTNKLERKRLDIEHQFKK
ncbi:hypothetical protein MC378_10330 [Polaribacter sp. MSW13]|uniref:Uncharacterized protein n=1 Tax=Polaribacter marinus TaxID=2916838 RepID=A0A9X1VN32_9FLAO|nr:hypothetical protein [Polaribacter marinus]MCI2229564.1 hypothetical protein [Polaribacter marinus]